MLIKYRRPLGGLEDFDRTVQALQESFGDLWGGGGAARPWTPAVDVFETDHGFEFKADVPEMKPEDLEVNFENSTLTLKGKREFEKKDEGKGYHRLERNYGSFVRAFTLPETVDPEKLTADYKNGVLSVSIGKKEIAKPRAVKVNVSAA